jgi:hypothetical protein
MIKTFADFENLFDLILSDYKEGENYQRLHNAKKSYIALTGMMNEEDYDYEARMNCFNDWFVFNHELPSGERVYQKFINQNNVEVDVRNALESVRYSVFDFTKFNIKKQVVLTDYVDDQKITLAKDSAQMGIVVDDFFIGHTVEVAGSIYLLKGIRTIPTAIRSQLKKQLKKLKKKGDFRKLEAFILHVENLKSKADRYSHIEPAKIFVFNEEYTV